jgi:hypothetical protein
MKQVVYFISVLHLVDPLLEERVHLLQLIMDMGNVAEMALFAFSRQT